MTLPVIHEDHGMLVADRGTGEVVPVREASDRTLAVVAEEIAALDRQVLEAKRVLAAELRQRHGVGRCHAGGYGFTITESQSWPVGATQDALDRLAAEGKIGEADVIRCMPERPKPDARQLKALIGRLTVSDPEAAITLANACTVSPPSLRDVQLESVEGTDA